MKESNPMLGDTTQRDFPYSLEYADALAKRMESILTSVQKRSAIHIPNIFILGPPRVGKTLLAETLSHELGNKLLKTDNERQIYLDSTDESSRDDARTFYFEKLLTTVPTGLIVEGDEAIKFRRTEEVDAGVSIRCFLNQESLARTEPVLISLGCADTTVVKKTEAILNYREREKCWTSKSHSDPARVEALAAWLIKTSAALKDYSATLGSRYFEISPHNFTTDLDAAAEFVRHEISVRIAG